MKLNRLNAGDKVWTVEKRRMGNTTINTVSVFPVRIVSVHENHVIASVNGNPARRYGETIVAKWKAEEPVLITNGFGAQRLATREEKAAAKAAEIKR